MFFINIPKNRMWWHVYSNVHYIYITIISTNLVFLHEAKNQNINGCSKISF